METNVTPNDTAYWIMRAEVAEKQCRDLEDETVATRELLEKSEERCEELERNRADLGAQLTSERMARHAKPLTAAPMSYWEAGVSCEVDGDLVIHRYKSVTVMVRGEREIFCWHCKGTWIPSQSGSRGAGYGSRPTCEAWCREQIEPRWREATEGDVGKACRVKDLKSDEWEPGGKLIAVVEYSFPYLAGDVDDDSEMPQLYAFCEVQD